MRLSTAIAAVAAVASLGLASSASASAGVIIAPTSATIDASGPGFGSISNTFDQSGLSIGYVAGVSGIYDDLSVAENVAFMAAAYGVRGGDLARERKAMLRISYNAAIAVLGREVLRLWALWTRAFVAHASL